MATSSLGMSAEWWTQKYFPLCPGTSNLWDMRFWLPEKESRERNLTLVEGKGNVNSGNPSFCHLSQTINAPGCYFFFFKHRSLSPIPDYPSSAHQVSPRHLDFLESIQVTLLLLIHGLMSSQNLNQCGEGELMISHISPSCHWTALTITKLLLYDETKLSLWLPLTGYFFTPWNQLIILSTRQHMRHFTCIISLTTSNTFMT